MKTFVDTNLFLYAHTQTGEKRRIACACIQNLWEQKSGLISTQVLAEFYVNLMKRWVPAPAPEVALELTSHYAAWPVVTLEAADGLQVCRLAHTARLSFWGALIIVAAAKAGAERLLTEDLNHGQLIAGVQIVNPFLTSDE